MLRWDLIPADLVLEAVPFTDGRWLTLKNAYHSFLGATSESDLLIERTCGAVSAVDKHYEEEVHAADAVDNR